MITSLVAIIFLMGACSKKDQKDISSSQTATLPTKASAYISTNYPDASIDYILVLSGSAAKYIASLNTTEELAFSGSGDYLGDGRLYHGNGEPGDTIPGDSTGCGGGHHGHHGHHGGHHGGGHHGGNAIPVDSLPAAIVSYIQVNYPGYTIRHAEYDSLCPDGAVKDVFIGTDSARPVKLVFAADNSFLLTASRIRYEDVPQAVKDYINLNYPRYQVCRGSEKFVLADNSVQYMIYLEQNRSHLRVRLTADGLLICYQ